MRSGRALAIQSTSPTPVTLFPYRPTRLVTVQSRAGGHAVGLYRLAIVSAGALLASCASSHQASVQQSPPSPITCSAGPDCDAKWSRAVSWIATNSSYKVQMQTDSLIQTMGPLDLDPVPAFTITKVAIPGGYEITFAGGCDNLIGCIPTVEESRAKFSAFVLAGSDAGNAAQPSLGVHLGIWLPLQQGQRSKDGESELPKLIQTHRRKGQACVPVMSWSALPGNRLATMNSYWIPSARSKPAEQRTSE